MKKKLIHHGCSYILMISLLICLLSTFTSAHHFTFVTADDSNPNYVDHQIVGVVFEGNKIVQATMDFNLQLITGAGGAIRPPVIFPAGDEYTFQATDGRNLNFYANCGDISASIEALPHTIAKLSLDDSNPAKTYVILEGQVGDQIVQLDFWGGTKLAPWVIRVDGVMSHPEAKLQQVNGGYELSGFSSFTVELESISGVRYEKTITNCNGETIRIDADNCIFAGGGLSVSLPCPENLIYTRTSASWGSVANATGYEIELYRVDPHRPFDAGKPEVFIDIYQTTETSITLPYTYEDHYIIAIRALDDSHTYEPSAFLYTPEMEILKLEAPKLISFVNSQASWESVDNAIGYAVSLRIYDGGLYQMVTREGIWNNAEHTDFTFRLMTYDYDKQYYIGLTANGEGHKYTSSDIVYYKMQWQTPAPENLRWANGVASWDSSKWANGYQVQIFNEDGTPHGDPVKTQQAYVNLSSKLEIGKKYTYKVFSLGDNDWYVDGKIATSGQYEHLKNTDGSGNSVSPEDNQIVEDYAHKCDAFVDITGHWGKSDICYCVENDLMNGVSATLFQPDAPMTRAMLVTVLYRMDGSTETGSSSFSDVPENIWYTNAVAWAQANQIVNGTSAEHFSPDIPITREQLATIMKRYADTKQHTLPESNAQSSAFADYPQVSAYAKDAVDWAVASGLISGKGNNQLDPQGQATRAEVAAILHRYMEN